MLSGMTTKELLNIASETFKNCFDILQRKNADYAQTEDALSNFRLVERLGVTDIVTGLLVRLADKNARIINLTKRPAKVLDERLEDTIQDAINYLVLLLAIIKFKGETNVSEADNTGDRSPQKITLGS